MSNIITERSGNILRIQLNRPEKKNAMTSAMYITLADLLNDAAKDDQIHVVLWHGAGENLKLAISSPIQMHGVAQVAAKRAPDLGEHNDEVLQELGFDTKEIERLRASRVIASPTLPASKPTAVAA